MRRAALASLLALALGAAVCQAQDCLEPVGRGPYGVSNSVAAQGDLALLANGAALQVVDLTDPSAPAVLGELYLAQPIEAVAISGDRGYVLTYDHLHVVDLSAPTAPSELGLLAGFIAGRGLDVVGDLVFVQGYDTLYVVNVANPTSPGLSGELEVSALDLVAVSDHVFLTSGYAGLRVVDVSDPTSPTEVAAVDLGADTSARYLDVVNGRAYVSGRGAPSDDKLFVVDLTDPNAPVVEADPVIAAGGGDIVVRDGLAHVFGGYPEALHIYDVTVPETPVWQGSATIPSAQYSERLAAIDDHVLVTTYLRGLTIVETTAPTAPAPVGRLDAPGRSSDAAYSDGVLFIAGEDRGLRMVDLSDPSNPAELGYTQVVPQAFGLAVRGGIAYVLGYSNQGLVAVDVSDPASPVILGNAPGAGGEWVTLAGDHAYVVNPHFGVYVVDVSTPAQPVQVGTLDLPSGTGEWWEWPVVSGDHLFVRNDHNDPSVAIIDVGVPTAPVLVGSIDVNANVAGLAVTGSWLLVPDFDAEPEVRIFDVTNPVAPVERDPYLPVGGYAEVVAVSGSVAYLSLWTGSYPDYEFAVEAVDFADPGAPEFMGLSHVTGPVRRLPAGPGQVFALTLETGFDVLTLCQGPIFADGFESGNPSAWTSAVP
ncbi:MAG TPA: hypothetical protein VLT32_05955 [Candidatus Sulfomarinibacteraceae bacterium]|nr:hypothetical protein [Candidatus Sulfomarinibacteraceae bacterium]